MDDKINERLWKIRNLMQHHKGVDNAITSDEIRRKIGVVHDDKNNYRTRQLILMAIEEFKIPIGASNEGYFIMMNPEELDNYQRNLRKRRYSIEQREHIITDAYLNYHTGGRRSK